MLEKVLAAIKHPYLGSKCWSLKAEDPPPLTTVLEDSTMKVEGDRQDYLNLATARRWKSSFPFDLEIDKYWVVLPHTFFVGCFCGLSLSTNATLEATAWPIWQEKYVHTVLTAGHNTAKLFCLQSIESVTKEKVSTVQWPWASGFCYQANECCS